jgi:hypothetical protein
MLLDVTEEQECESARKYWAETGDINGTHTNLVSFLKNVKQLTNTIISFPNLSCCACRAVWSCVSCCFYAGTLRKLPRQLFIERLLLQGYQKMGKTQHLAAFQTVLIPFTPF